VYRTRDQYATAGTAREQLRENRAGGTGLKLLGEALG